MTVRPANREDRIRKCRMRCPVIFLTMACLTLLLPSASPRAAVLPRFCTVHTAQSALRSATSVPNQGAPMEGVHLIVNRTRVSPFTAIYARLVNFSSDVAGYGREFQIQQLGAEGWEPDPASPAGPWIKVRGLIRPGYAGRCFRFNIPVDEGAGWHRFVTQVELGLNRRRSIRTASFIVLQP